MTVLEGETREPPVRLKQNPGQTSPEGRVVWAAWHPSREPRRCPRRWVPTTRVIKSCSFFVPPHRVWSVPSNDVILAHEMPKRKKACEILSGHVVSAPAQGQQRRPDGKSLFRQCLRGERCCVEEPVREPGELRSLGHRDEQCGGAVLWQPQSPFHIPRRRRRSD